MKISELFHSIQGEGKLAGVPSVFIRTSGCNLRCVWCDTPYSSWTPEGRDASLEEIVTRTVAFKTRHVVLTGGEPVIQPEAAELCKQLKQHGLHVTLETAGTIHKPLAIDLASLSPKLANSTPLLRDGGRWAQTHEQTRLNLPVLQRFIDDSPDFQLKFVVSRREDLDEIRGILDGLHGWLPEDVLLMPEGIDPATLHDRAEWLVELCKETGFRYCPRLHVDLWGPARGK